VPLRIPEKKKTR